MREVTAQETLFGSSVVRAAEFSKNRTYRYWLSREWAPSQGRVLWILLNPSTADAERDDPTMRRCHRFSADWGYGAMIVLNLWAYRSPYPKRLVGVKDPVGPQNDYWFGWWAERMDLCLVGWGASFEPLARARWNKVLGILELHNQAVDPLCLGRTRSGAPQHPLFVNGRTRPAPWEGYV